jgi:hypothetical protein
MTISAVISIVNIAIYCTATFHHTAQTHSFVQSWHEFKNPVMVDSRMQSLMNIHFHFLIIME